MSEIGYEDLVRGGFKPRKSGLLAALRAMQPGDVLDVSALTSSMTPGNVVGAYARQLGKVGHIVTRTRGGRTYAIHLRPEDVHA